MAASDVLPKTQEPKEYIAVPKFNLKFIIQLVSEFLATFIFNFVILGNVLTQNATGSTGSLAQLFSFGMATFLTVTALTYSFGQLSGAHFNPVLTAGLMFALRMNWLVGILYIVVQFLSSFAAVGILDALFPGSGIVSSLVVSPPLGETGGGAFFLQFLGATYFVFTYLFFRYDADPAKVSEGMTTGEKKKAEESQLRYFIRQNLTPLMIGFSYAAATLVGVYLNPWSVLSVCMIAGECGNAWIYNVGGFLGALFAALLFVFLYGFGKEAAPARMNPVMPPATMEEN